MSLWVFSFLQWVVVVIEFVLLLAAADAAVGFALPAGIGYIAAR